MQILQWLTFIISLVLLSNDNACPVLTLPLSGGASGADSPLPQLATSVPLLNVPRGQNMHQFLTDLSYE